MTVNQAIENGLVMATEDRRKYGIIPCRSIKENISLPNLKELCRSGFINQKKEQGLVQAYFERLRIKANSMNVDAFTLSGGNQQKVVIGKGILTEPKILLMDEPTSALDPIATNKIEDLMEELKKDYTIVIVTHSMQQASRVSDYTAFFLLGEVVEFNKTSRIFQQPCDKRTEDYITGRFG